MSAIVGVPPKIVTPTVEQINSDRITEVNIIIKTFLNVITYNLYVFLAC